MKIEILTLLCLLPLAPINAKDFVNFNFDDGAFPSGPIPDFLQPADLVLPGWTARMGDHVLSEVIWNNALSENGFVGVYSTGGPGGPCSRVVTG